MSIGDNLTDLPPVSSFTETTAWKGQASRSDGWFVLRESAERQFQRDRLRQEAALGGLDVGMPSLSVTRGLLSEIGVADRVPSPSPGSSPTPTPASMFASVSSGGRAGNFAASFSQPTVPQQGPYGGSGAGGGVAPGLREPSGSRLSLEQRAIAVRMTGFDPGWGTPPDVRLVGSILAWNPARYIYELGSKVPSGGQELAAAETRERWLRLASRGIYYQAYKATPDGGGPWLYRYVRVSTPFPELSAPYDLGGEYLDGSWAQGAVSDGQKAAKEAHDKALYEASWAGRLASGQVSEDSMFMLPLESLYDAPKREFSMADYAWVEQRDLPVACPYPYEFMPVPQADYASGFWLDPDYVPSIPLPPPYDEIPWQCGVPKETSERKGKGKASPPPGVEEEPKKPKSEGPLVPRGPITPRSEGDSESNVLPVPEPEPVPERKKTAEELKKEAEDAATREIIEADPDVTQKREEKEKLDAEIAALDKKRQDAEENSRERKRIIDEIARLSRKRDSANKALDKSRERAGKRRADNLRREHARLKYKKSTTWNPEKRKEIESGIQGIARALNSTNRVLGSAAQGPMVETRDAIDPLQGQQRYSWEAEKEIAEDPEVRRREDEVERRAAEVARLQAQRDQAQPGSADRERAQRAVVAAEAKLASARSSLSAARSNAAEAFSKERLKQLEYERKRLESKKQNTGNKDTLKRLDQGIKAIGQEIGSAQEDLLGVARSELERDGIAAAFRDQEWAWQENRPEDGDPEVQRQLETMRRLEAEYLDAVDRLGQVARAGGDLSRAQADLERAEARIESGAALLTQERESAAARLAIRKRIELRETIAEENQRIADLERKKSQTWGTQRRDDLDTEIDLRSRQVADQQEQLFDLYRAASRTRGAEGAHPNTGGTMHSGGAAKSVAEGDSAYAAQDGSKTPRPSTQQEKMVVHDNSLPNAGGLRLDPHQLVAAWPGDEPVADPEEDDGLPTKPLEEMTPDELKMERERVRREKQRVARALRDSHRQMSALRNRPVTGRDELKRKNQEIKSLGEKINGLAGEQAEMDGRLERITELEGGRTKAGTEEKPSGGEGGQEQKPGPSESGGVPHGPLDDIAVRLEAAARRYALLLLLNRMTHNERTEWIQQIRRRHAEGDQSPTVTQGLEIARTFIDDTHEGGRDSEPRVLKSMLDQAAVDFRSVLTSQVGRSGRYRIIEGENPYAKGYKRMRGVKGADGKTYYLSMVLPTSGVFDPLLTKWKHNGDRIGPESGGLPEVSDPNWRGEGLILGWSEDNKHVGVGAPDFIGFLRPNQTLDGGTFGANLPGNPPPTKGHKIIKYKIEPMQVHPGQQPLTVGKAGSEATLYDQLFYMSLAGPHSDDFDGRTRVNDKRMNVWGTWSPKELPKSPDDYLLWGFHDSTGTSRKHLVGAEDVTNGIIQHSIPGHEESYEVDRVQHKPIVNHQGSQAARPVRRESGGR